MLRDNRGNAAIMYVGVAFIAFMILLLGLYSARIYAENYQANIKKQSITMEEATEALQLKNDLKNLSLNESETVNVEVKSGNIKTVKIDPLFNTTKKVKEEFNLNSVNTPISLIDSPSLTNFKSVYDYDVKSNRFAEFAVLHDSDGSENVNRKASEGGTDIKTRMVSIEKTQGYKGNVISLVDHPLTNTLDADDPQLSTKPLKVSLYLNGTLVASKPFSGSSVVSFTSDVGALQSDDILTYEYYNTSNKIFAIANIYNNNAPRTIASVYSSNTKLSETIQLVLNEDVKFQVDDSVNSDLKGDDDIITNADLYQNLKVNYYNELVCNYKQVHTPIAYINRSTTGNDYPNTDVGSATISTAQDLSIPTKESFKKETGKDALSGSFDFDGKNTPNGEGTISPCASTALQKVTAYDGIHMWYNPLKKYQAFINGFNTIPQATLARFEGSKANGDGKTFSDTQASVTNQDTVNKYNYRHNTRVTTAPGSTKLYCSDYTINKYNNATAKAYPYILDENQFWWNEKFAAYEVYVKAELAKFNTLYQSVQWTNGTTGSNTPLPVWDEAKHSFENWMKTNGYYKTVGGTNVADTRIPCITDIGRNQVHIQYKPRLDSYSEVNYNIVNNSDSEYTITLKADINQNFYEEIKKYQADKKYYSIVNPSASNTRDRYLNDYTGKTELEAVKGWLEEYTTYRARVYISSKNNSIYTKGDNTTETPDGFYLDLEPLEGSFDDVVNQSTGEITLTYKFKLGANYTNATLKSLHEDIANTADFTQVRFYAYMGNAFFKHMTIESETIDKAYFKVSSLSEEGKVLREDFVEVGQ